LNLLCCPRSLRTAHVAPVLSSVQCWLLAGFWVSCSCCRFAASRAP